jgi:FtsZ-binding cell division protein ZapB
MTKWVASQPENGRESCNFAQLGLDFTSSGAYINLSEKKGTTMNNELFATLDHRITELLEKYNALKKTNHELAEENQQLRSERESFKSGVDSILSKLEGI